MNGNTFYFGWEAAFIKWAQGLYGSAAGFAAKIFELFGSELILVAVICLVYWCFDKRFARRIASGFVFAMLSGSMIKNIVLRRRPYMDIEGVKCLKPIDPSADAADIKAQGYAFPSMHTANTGAAYFALASGIKRVWAYVAASVITVLVGASRIIAGVHYPTDIIGGALLGAVSLFCSLLLEKYVKKTWVQLLIFSAAGLPGWFFCKSDDFFTAYGLRRVFLRIVLFLKIIFPICLFQAATGVSLVAAFQLPSRKNSYLRNCRRHLKIQISDAECEKTHRSGWRLSVRFDKIMR